MKVLLFTPALILVLSSCAQTVNIKKAFAFYQSVNSGAPPVYKNGKAISKSLTREFIYLEISGNTKPKIKEVTYKGNVYSDVQVYLVGQQQINAGIAKATGSPVMLSPAKGDTFWRLEIIIPESTIEHPISRQNKIIVKGESEGRSFSIKIDNEKELKPLIGY